MAFDLKKIFQLQKSNSVENEYELPISIGAGTNDTRKLSLATFYAWILGRIKSDIGDLTKGEPGTKGLKGDQGEPGQKGDKGDKGDTGAQGLKGDVGPQGLQGIQGQKGDTGAQGASGEEGLQGIQGEKGDKGDQGLTGADGVSAYQTWLDAGNAGTEADFIASLKGEPGQKGDKGDTGAQGLKGDVGPQGLQGLQGLKGDKGDTGVQGGKGDKGDMPTLTDTLDTVTARGDTSNRPLKVAQASGTIALGDVGNMVRIQKSGADNDDISILNTKNSYTNLRLANGSRPDHAVTLRQAFVDATTFTSGASKDFNNMRPNTTDFMYANNTNSGGRQGVVAYLGSTISSSYGFQLIGSYVSGKMSFRATNGDNGSWGSWRDVLDETTGFKVLPNDSIDLLSNTQSNIGGKLFQASNAAYQYGPFFKFGNGGYFVAFNANSYPINGELSFYMSGDGVNSGWCNFWHSKNLLSPARTDRDNNFTTGQTINGNLQVNGKLSATNVVTNDDSFTSTPAANNIVTLTQAEYNALSSKNSNTLYIVI